jgi:uncharacterized protein (TIGR01777 family)
MRIFITGGTGFVGTCLTRELTAQGHQVTLLTRTVTPGRTLPAGAVFLEGNPLQPGPWQKAVPEHQAFINLAGASIFSRWTDSTKKEIRESRILTTRNLVTSLEERQGRDTLLLSTSAVGYYGFHEDEELSEDAPSGTDFLSTLARDWEAEAQRAESFGVRVIRCRFGIVLGKGGGALDQMLPLFKKGLGSPLGSGRQWFSWIHQRDLIRIFLFLLDRQEVSGPLNCTAPHPVTNQELTRLLAEALGKPAFLPAVPGFMLKLVMGEFGDVLLKGQRVLPQKLLRLGFNFLYPDLKKTLQDLLQR